MPTLNNNEKILNQINEEYLAGKKAVQNKRTTLQNDLKKYYVESTKKDKVSIHSIYTTMQTLMSVYFNDKSEVEFDGRTENGDKIAENLNKLAEFDYEEMNLNEIDYQWNFDRFFHGVGIKIIDGWNSITNTPIAKVVSPLSWIPDPQGGFSIESHRWAGFEIEVTKAQLKSFKGFDKNLIELVNNKGFDEQDVIKRAYSEGRDINSFLNDTEENSLYSIYNHYTRIDGIPYLITTANHNTLLLRKKQLLPATEEEKKNSLLISFPIALKYYSPIKGDPFGISIPDLLRDKQTAESKLFNLTLISATRNALGDDKLYNPKKIKNIKDLKTPTIGGKYIAANVNEGESLNNALLTVPKENPTSLPFNVEDGIRQQNSLSTGINANTLGVGGMQNMTAAESQSIQKNANLRFILGTRIGSWGEKSFWKQWLRSYYLHLLPSKEKVFKITKTFGSSYFSFKRTDLIINENLVINIKAKSEKDAEMAKYKNDLYALAPQYIADPSTPSIGKLKLKRKMLDFGLFSQGEIEEITFNVDEQQAKLDLELLNENLEPTEIKEGQDHLIFMSVFYQAKDSDKKWKAISDRKNAYLKEQTKNKEQQSYDNTALNMASNNAASRQSAIIQQESNQVASLQNL